MQNFFDKIQGYKTYGLNVFAILVALVGHFWGPFTIVGIPVPSVDNSTVWQTFWLALSAVFIRNGITTEVAKIDAPAPPTPPNTNGK